MQRRERVLTGRVLLLGSTDFTLSVADAVERSGAGVGAIVYVGDNFQISYAPNGVKNYRAADIPGWCSTHGARAIRFEDFAALAAVLALGGFEIAILAGWYHMAPKSFRASLPRGCIGFHASLLPQLRGGAPLNWAILSNYSETGLSLFRVDDGVDDGPLYDQERIAIGPRAYIAELVEASRVAAAHMIERSLLEILEGRLLAKPQVGTPSYCLQRTPEDGRVDWRQSAGSIDRLVRAVSRPYPGALTMFDGKAIAIHRSQPLVGPEVFGAPGQIARIPGAPGPIVVCGDGCLAIEDAQFETGDDAMPVLRASANKRFAGW